MTPNQQHQQTTIKTIKIGGRSFQLPQSPPQPQPTTAAPTYVAAWEKVHAALQADRYRIIAKIDNADAPAPAGAKDYGNFCYGKSRATPEQITATGAFAGFTPAEVARELPDMAKRDQDKRYGHYICPLSAGRHYILIDDCSTPEKQAAADKYHAALILTSSPGNQQRIIIVNAHTDPEVARLAANKLSEHLNREAGDLAVKNGQQDWRLPHFHNHKPRRIQEDGTSPRAELISADGGTCPRAQALYDGFAQQIEQQQNQPQQHQQHQQPQQPRQEQPTTTIAAATPGEWAPCGIKWQDVYLSAIKQIAHGYARRGVEPPAGHRLDYTVAVRLAVIGYDRNQIAAAIAHGAPAAEAARIRTAKGESPNMGKDWNAYAAIKAGEAFTAQGQAQVSKYSDKAASWRKEEARDARQIQREYERAGIEIPAQHKRQQQKQNNERGMEM